MIITYTFPVRQSGAFVPGLTPAFAACNRISDGVAVAAPTITEVKPSGGSGAGYYKFDWDPEANGEIVGIIDAGNTISSNSERLIEVAVYKDSSRINTALPNAALGDGSGRVTQVPSDKTGYALTAGEHTLISGTDVPAALTAQGATTARLGYLANLNVGGLVASASALSNIQNNSFVGTNIPVTLERPDAGSESLIITVTIADATGAAVDIDAGANPTITLIDDASTDLSARLSAWSHPATGKFTIVYTNALAHPLGRLHWEITATVNGKLRRYVATTQIVDITAVDFTSTDRTALATLQATLDAIKGIGWTNETLVALQAAIAQKLNASGYTAPPSAATVAAATRTELTTELGRITTALPNAAPGAPGGLPRTSDLPAAAPSAGTIASATRTELAPELGRITTALPASAPGTNAGIARKQDVATGGSGGGDVVASIIRVRDVDGSLVGGSNAQRITLTKGDTAPIRRVMVCNEFDVPIDLTGATVWYRLRQTRGTGAGTSDNDIHVQAEIEPGTVGVARYEWALDGTDTDADGTYEETWEVTLPSGRKFTAPNDGCVSVLIRPN